MSERNWIRVALVIAVMLIVSMFAACGGGGDDEVCDRHDPCWYPGDETK